jgi:RNA polymerase sigma-70 factor (ECF subfamily)
MDTTDCAGRDHASDLVALAYEEHAAELRRRMTALARDPEVAEDVVHDAFIRLLEQIRRHGTPDNVGGWLHRVATNAFISRARRAQVADRYAGRVEGPRDDASPEQQLEAREAFVGMNRALERLAEDDRHALVLAAGGSSRAEIGVRLGRSEVAARALVSRARGRLRIELGELGIAM